METIGRRDFVRLTAAAAAGIAVTSTAAHGASPTHHPRFARPETPDVALARLMAGNERFVQGRTVGDRRDLARVRELAEGQSPYAAILSCADSRVPPELLFDEGFGDLFVVRVAGNVAGTEEVASLEYAAGVLGSQVIMVLGHTSCGAVGAAAARGAVPGQISALFSHILPAVEEAEGDTAEAIRINVRNQARLVRRASPVVAQMVSEGRLRVVGGVYDLATGSVEIVDRGDRG
ncbi:MAG TPA: carbonic anhydrase [Longimicrobiales bacterium]|nr:carbonic anhydrase [Longimicrobiales bacterium]